MVLAIQTLAESTHQFRGAVPGKDILPSHGLPLEMARGYTTTDNTIVLLRHLFTLYGVPDQVVSDNGSQFVTKDFAVFMKSNWVKYLRCSPYHPASNGAVCQDLPGYQVNSNSSWVP